LVRNTVDFHDAVRALTNATEQPARFMPLRGMPENANTVRKQRSRDRFTFTSDHCFSIHENMNFNFLFEFQNGMLRHTLHCRFTAF
jgi:hypothetical protein